MEQYARTALNDPAARCKRGHDPAEYHFNSKGHRECRACDREIRAEKRRLDRPPPLAFVAPRRSKRRSDAKLTRRQVHAARVLYEAGWSVPQIVEQRWNAWGYASAHDATTALYRAFKLDGIQARSYRDSLIVRYSAQSCRCVAAG